MENPYAHNPELDREVEVQVILRGGIFKVRRRHHQVYGFRCEDTPEARERIIAFCFGNGFVPELSDIDELIFQRNTARRGIFFRLARLMVLSEKKLPTTLEVKFEDGEARFYYEFITIVFTGLMPPHILEIEIKQLATQMG